MRSVSRFLGASLMLLAGGALAQEQPKPPGEGVLCGYVIYAGALLDAEICGWVDTPTGQAIRQSVADFEAYMLANSSTPETIAGARSNYAAGVAMMKALSAEQRAAFCQGLDPDRPNYFGAMRNEDPDKLIKATQELLSRAGEPTYGYCF